MFDEKIWYSYAHSNHVTSNKQVDTLICYSTMHRNAINFLYNPGHMTFWCLEVVQVVYARVIPMKYWAPDTSNMYICR